MIGDALISRRREYLMARITRVRDLARIERITNLPEASSLLSSILYFTDDLIRAEAERHFLMFLNTRLKCRVYVNPRAFLAATSR